MKTGLMVNIDINMDLELFLHGIFPRESVTPEDLYPLVDIYKDTQVTDLVFTIFCQYSLTPSKIMSDLEYKYSQKTENGHPVDYTERYEPMHLLQTKFGYNPVDLWIRRTRANGQRAKLQVRMNDCHFWPDDTNFLRGDFIYEAREKGWMVGDCYGFWHPFLNYAVPEVRQKMLAYIEEQLGAFDVDGLELDYQRELRCFNYPNCPDAVQIMTDFLAEVKALVRKAEARVGHPIELAVRTCPDPAYSRAFGLDGEKMVQAGVDRIILAPHFATIDSDMPLAAWKAMLPDTPITACLEMYVNRMPDEKHYSGATPALLRGYSAHYLAEGSDGIYLFNNFVNPLAPEEFRASKHESYTTCGSLETAATLPQMQLLTFPDSAPDDIKLVPPLPTTVEKEFAYTFRCGIVPTHRVELIFGVNKDEDAAALGFTVNGVPVTNLRKGGDGEVFAANDTLLYTGDVPQEAWAADMAVAVTSDKPAVLTYLAISNY